MRIRKTYLIRNGILRLIGVGIMLCLSVCCMANDSTVALEIYASKAPLSVPMQILGLNIPDEWRDLLTIACGIGVILLMLRVWEERQNQKQNIAYMQYEMQKAKIEEARRMEQMQAEADKKIAQAQIKRLNAEIDGKRDALHRALVERIALAQHIREYARASNAAIPNWLQEYLNEYSFANPAKWKAFRKEFDNAYNDFVPYLQQQYPVLTDSDVQYLVLATLGFDTPAIACLLGKTERTIWNRRDIIKGRIGNSSLHLEDWLAEVVEDYKSRA